MSYNSRASICIECNKGGGLCPWSRDFEPVPGWTAEKKVLRAKQERYRHTYEVKACPLYEPRRSKP